MALKSEMLGGGVPAGMATGIVGGAGSVAATGASSSQALAAPVKSSTMIVTAGDGTKSVILPAVEPGEWVTLFNNSGSTVPVFPPVGSAICVPGTGLGSANASFSLLTYKTAVFICQSSTQWFVNVSA